MYCYVGYFVDFFFWERIEGGVGDGGVIVLNNGEFVDFYFQLFVGMVYQNVLLFEWVYQFKNIVDIIDGCLMDLFCVFYDDLGVDVVV